MGYPNRDKHLVFEPLHLSQSDEWTAGETPLQFEDIYGQLIRDREVRLQGWPSVYEPVLGLRAPDFAAYIELMYARREHLFLSSEELILSSKSGLASESISPMYLFFGMYDSEQRAFRASFERVDILLIILYNRLVARGYLETS